MKRTIVAAAFVAAFGATAAQAQDWSQFIGTHSLFPTRLTDRGLAVDQTTGEVAVQALSNPYGTNDFIHEYTLTPAGGPLPWALFGRYGTDTVLEPNGVDVAGGHRVTWLHRGNAFTTTNDHIYGIPNGGSWPTWEFAVSRFDGTVSAIASDGSGGAYVLRQFEPAWPPRDTFELIALDAAGAPRWRHSYSPCAGNWMPQQLTLDVDPATDTLTVAGACGFASFNRHVFAQRVSASGIAAPMPVYLPYGWNNELHDLAFTRAHALVVAFTNAGGVVELRRLAPGTNAPSPPMFADPALDVASLRELVASGVDDVLLASDGVRAPVVQRYSPAGPQAAFALDVTPGNDWRLAASLDERLLMLSLPTQAGVTYLSTVLFDSNGSPQREFKLGGIVAGVGPRVVAPPDGGFVVAIDRRIADGTIGVAVERIVEASDGGVIELPWP